MLSLNSPSSRGTFDIDAEGAKDWATSSVPESRALLSADGVGDSGSAAEDGARAPPPLTARETTRLVATIIKSFIGSGVLFLPKAFANGGWAFSIAALTLMAALSLLTILRLIEARARFRGS
jgi:hypothetical protein